jgi:hypothetical protein
LFGEVDDGYEWMREALIKAKTESRIKDWQLLNVERGHWGIQFILFTVDIPVPPISYEEAGEHVYPEISKIVGDPDVTILWVSEPNKENE